MGWATGHIERLRPGETVSFRPRGGSVTGRIESDRLCTVAPAVDCTTLVVDDIVPCRVKSAESQHLIKSIQRRRFQVGNNRGYVNGWIGPNSIFGICVRIEA
jgi:hypothetical protein